MVILEDMFIQYGYVFIKWTSFLLAINTIDEL